MPSSEFQPKTLDRTSPYAKELIGYLEPYSSLRLAAEGKRLALGDEGQKMCYLLIKGSVGLYRGKDDRLLQTLNAPAIVGIGHLLDTYLDMYCVRRTTCKLGLLTLQKTQQAIEEKTLWPLLSRHLIFGSNRLYEYLSDITAPSAYESICIQLYELMSESPNFRDSLSAEKYIRAKTQLSRSYVMKILAALKEGEYIELDEGRLVKINKLPAKY